MNEQQRAAFIQSQAACAIVEALGMIAENQKRQHMNYSMAYGEEAFQKLIETYGLGHNQVIAFLQGDR